MGKFKRYRKAWLICILCSYLLICLLGSNNPITMIGKDFGGFIAIIIIAGLFWGFVLMIFMGTSLQQDEKAKAQLDQLNATKAVAEELRKQRKGNQ